MKQKRLTSVDKKIKNEETNTFHVSQLKNELRFFPASETDREEEGPTLHPESIRTVRNTQGGLRLGIL